MKSLIFGALALTIVSFIAIFYLFSKDGDFECRLSDGIYVNDNGHVISIEDNHVSYIVGDSTIVSAEADCPSPEWILVRINSNSRQLEFSNYTDSLIIEKSDFCDLGASYRKR